MTLRRQAHLNTWKSIERVLWINLDSDRFIMESMVKTTDLLITCMANLQEEVSMLKNWSKRKIWQGLQTIIMILKSLNINLIRENLLVNHSFEDINYLQSLNNKNLLSECLPLEVKVQRMFFIQKVEKRRKDLKFQQCTIRHMELLDLVNKSIETMFGQSLKQSIDLVMLKRKFRKAQVFHSIQKELTEYSQKR